MNRLQLLSRHLHSIPAHRLALCLPFIYMGVIFLLSSIPGAQPPVETAPWLQTINTIIYNGAHIPLFALLAWLWCWSLAGWNTPPRRRLMLAFCFTTIYGVVDEWHQSFTPGRDTSFLDVMLDMLGAYIAVCFYRGQQQAVTNG